MTPLEQKLTEHNAQLRKDLKLAKMQLGNMRALCSVQKHALGIRGAALVECLPFVKSYLGGDHPIVKNAKAAIDIQIKPG
jgi:hypothetical protein